MKKGLGRGLDALFSIYEEDNEPKVEIKTAKPEVAEEPKQNGVVELDIKRVDPNMNQPRKYFEPTALKELSESIKQHGVIQPIIVNEEKNGRYTIIAGERRFRASLIAGLKTIPAIIKQYTPKQVKEVALVENLQREDLNPIEAAKAIKQLMDDYSFTQESVADRIGKSRPVVANTLRLLSLSDEVVSMIEKNKISAGHGRCLVVVEDKQKQIEIANIVIENKLSVRDLETLIKNYSSNSTKQITKEKPKQSIELKELGHRLQRLFRTKVKIAGDDNKGKILIDYFNRDDLDRICKFIDTLENN
ncbi:MAG: ParB/RepB/Spo0J family partition protein [Clostridia bacterium]|nr:ParB/RepB/Spo0J family partition protein [Clostridia bacterium]